MRETSNPACFRKIAAASFGTSPVWAKASALASSTSSQARYLFSSVQIRPISGRVYRSIISVSEDLALLLRLGNHQAREERTTRAIQCPIPHYTHKLRMIVVFTNVA